MKNLALPFAALLIAGCMTRSPAPVDDRRPAPVAQSQPLVMQSAPVTPAPPPGYYTVKRGDTLYSIALEHGVDYRDVARWNNIDPTKLSIGQQLQITPPPGEAVQIGGATRRPGEIESRPLGSASPGAAPIPSGVKDGPKALRLPYSEQNLAMLAGKPDSLPVPPVAVVKPPVPPVPVPSAPAVPPVPAAGDRDPEAIDFAWPVKGRILAGFSEATNKGVDISGKLGDPVLAAAAGRVMYTGTGIRGYGKLIVIKHDNNYNSVYAHNREILVKEGQNVTRGQRIAELGDSDADAPKLHFEIRKSGKPVDPMRYLPQP
jgi:lipoprotein NlpD